MAEGTEAIAWFHLSMDINAESLNEVKGISLIKLIDSMLIHIQFYFFFLFPLLSVEGKRSIFSEVFSMLTAVDKCCLRTAQRECCKSNWTDLLNILAYNVSVSQLVDMLIKVNETVP